MLGLGIALLVGGAALIFRWRIPAPGGLGNIAGLPGLLITRYVRGRGSPRQSDAPRDFQKGRYSPPLPKKLTRSPQEELSQLP